MDVQYQARREVTMPGAMLNARPWGGLSPGRICAQDWEDKGQSGEDSVPREGTKVLEWGASPKDD